MQPAHSHWKFVDDKRTPVYKTLAAELDAIRAKKKSISFFATDPSGLVADLAEIRPLADKRDLHVTVGTRGKSVDIFVHRPGEAVRVGPLQKLLSQPWTFETEAKLGVLLGYTAAQRAAWLKAERHARPAFGVLTLYGTIAYGMPNWWWTMPNKVAALGKPPMGGYLWRVGVDPQYAKKLDKRGHAILSSFVKARAFDKVVRTEFERLTPKGWKRGDPRTTH